jgi:hypothetical protein
VEYPNTKERATTHDQPLSIVCAMSMNSLSLSSSNMPEYGRVSTLLDTKPHPALKVQGIGLRLKVASGLKPAEDCSTGSASHA